MKHNSIGKTGYLIIFALSMMLSGKVTLASDDLAAYREASSRLQVVVHQAEREGDNNRLQTEEINQLVAVLSDQERFLKSKAYKVEELGTLLELCGMSNRAVMSLMLFDLADRIDARKTVPATTGQLLVIMQENAETFSGQLRYLQPFLLRCSGMQITLLGEFIGTLPPEQLTETRRGGLQTARIGIVELIVGVLQSLENPNLSVEYRQALVTSLAEAAPELVAALPVDVRGRILANTNSGRILLQQRFKPALEKLREVLSSTRCEGLCGI